MPSLSDNNVKIHVSSDADNKGIDSASHSLDELGGHADTVSTKTIALGSAIGALVANGLERAASGFLSMGKEAISSAGDFEQSRVAFEVMLGSADKARKMMSDISVFAKETPFELPEVVQGTKQLIAYGFSQGEVLNTMRRLGDVAAGVGVPLNQVALAYGQVKVKGHLAGQEMLQFQGAGIDMAGALSKVLGTTKDKIAGLQEQGKISFGDVEKAMASMTDKGGAYFGMMEKQSHTFNGVVSNIKDGFGQMLRAAVGVSSAGDIVAGGVFDRIKSAAEKMMPMIQSAAGSVGPAVGQIMDDLSKWSDKFMDVYKAVANYLEPKLKALGKAIGNLMPELKDTIRNYLAPMAQALGTLLVGAIGAVITGVTDLLRAFRPVLDWINRNVSVVYGLVSAFAAFYAMLEARAAFIAIESSLTAMRMGFVLTTIATVGLREALTIFMTQAAIAATFMGGPFTLALAAVVGIAGLVGWQWRQNKTDADLNAQAQDNLKRSTQELKDAQNELKDAQLNLEGAGLRVEAAQKNYNETVANFGPKSLEARQALHDLHQAQKDLEDATNRTKDATQKLSDKQAEVAKNKELIKHLSETKDSLDNIVKSADGAVYSIGKLMDTAPKATNAAGTKINLAPLLKRAGGGPVSSGTPYIVGENEPELFVPNQSGTIMNQKQIAQAAGGRSGGGNGSVFHITVQQMILPGVTDRSSFVEELDQDTILTGRGLTPNRGIR